MKDLEVLVQFEQQTIYVNKYGLSFSFAREQMKKLPTGVDANEIIEIWWNVSGQCSYQIKGESTANHFGEEHYDDYVKPYVDLWQAEKDKLEKERQEAEAEYNSFPNVKEALQKPHL